MVDKNNLLEEKDILDVNLGGEVSVERKEFDEFIDVAPPAVRQEGDVTIISVVKEVLVVEKRLKLVEEVRITKNSTRAVVPVTETLGKELITIDRADTGTNFEPLW